ncbi:hypothetical protein TSUD_181960 [Trifolium subterraneum]|uniref:Uncharacterized protein n=1 Tax=Trifolium subterraneum TaxID=3900 RepID=A0A2Z6NZU7_TRISU|nr:hypothetical protein TSUD_181960 [Trifolium subterraneum]
MENDGNNNNNNNNNKNKIGDDEIVVSNSKGESFFDFSPKKSIAERRGFNNNVAKINTRISHFGGTISLVSPAVQSARLTIPPGISPTTLLESPIMLPNSLVMPSPTTGSFAMLPPLNDGSSMLTSVTNEQRKLDVATASFRFKPQANLDPNSLSSYYDSLNQSLQLLQTRNAVVAA